VLVKGRNFGIIREEKKTDSRDQYQCAMKNGGRQLKRTRKTLERKMMHIGERT
jgi:hypothetical protein